MKTLLKGIIVGIGGIAPGLSGSVLLVILGLYQKALNAISTLFKNFKKNIAFLIPLIIGFGIGVLIFSKVVDFFLNNFEMQTRSMFINSISMIKTTHIRNRSNKTQVIRNQLFIQ